MKKPLLVFDGDCGFCRLWITRWKGVTQDRVDYAPFQEVAKNFPDIPLADFQKAIQLIEPDGGISSGAHAVFRALNLGGHPGALWAYGKLPGFAPASEFFYGLVAGHRPVFSNLTRALWGNPTVPSSYRQVRWIFLRALALTYASAFWSFGLQIRGLIGSQGILPAQDFLNMLARYGAAKFWFVPTLAWTSASDSFLIGLCVAGVVLSLTLLLNIAPRLSLVALWGLYLSLVSVGGDFMSFQWDALLLETGFLAIFFAPSGFLPQLRGARPPAPAILFLLRWLLFRLMFQSALVKWQSGDLLWRHFTALTVHYQTQPLPNLVSWYAHHLPLGFQKFSCIMMFVIEGLTPFLIFMPRRSRWIAFWAFVLLQGLILLTGNYTYFNWLTLALCLLLWEDQTLRSWAPAWWDEPLAAVTGGRMDAVRQKALVVLVLLVMVLTSISFGQRVGIHWPRAVLAPAVALSSLRSFNSYGLFAVMTPSRPEIILEGSNDQKTWEVYEFKYKPGDLARRPAQVAPHQPRLDWQMWFAALGDYRQNPWFMNLCVRVLQGSKPVLNLLEKNPFSEKPPLYLRATVYDYRFTTPEERRQTGRWWAREIKGLYCPVLSLNKELS